jgi:hypothetical protein
MWKVGDESTMKVVCNPESNFPISIELLFGGPLGSRAENSHGMWFGVEDARRLISQLEQAIEAMRAVEHVNEPDGATCARCNGSAESHEGGRRNHDFSPRR